MPETPFDHLKRYVGFGPADEQALRALHRRAAPRFAAVAEIFYDRILGDPAARSVLQGGEGAVGRLKETMRQWLDLLLTGPWDDAYYQRRCRIGRVHVRIQLPQHLMFGAGNVLRRELEAVVDEEEDDRATRRAMRAALGRILDLELAIMLHTFREDLEEQQGRAARLAAFGQLVGSIAHELRNPLGVIETSLYLLRNRLGEDERARKHADRIHEHLQIAAGIIGDLLEMIRERPLQRETLSLAEVLEGAVKLARNPGAAIAVSGAGGIAVEGDAGQLRQVFVNLIQNGAEAAGPGGRVAVRASAGEQVSIEIEDSGPGVSEEVCHRLFEPLITTRPKGIGLGLALVKRMVERHGGCVGCERRTAGEEGLGGARFVVRLPRAGGAA